MKIHSIFFTTFEKSLNQVLTNDSIRSQVC